LLFVGVLAVLLGACGGGGDSVRSALAPSEALAASADKFSQDASSMSGTFTMNFSGNGSSVEMKGDYSFEAPDRFYMTMDVLGNKLEMLMIPPDFYLYFPERGWYQIDTNAFGVNFDALKKYADSRGPIDYSSIAKQIKGISQLPDEEIGGKPYLHYGGNVDFNSLADQLPEGVVDSGALDVAKDAVDTVRTEVWVDKDTYLPRRFNMGFDFNPNAGQGFTMEMRMDILQYNAPVDIPAAPSNAQPLSELTLQR